MPDDAAAANSGEVSDAMSESEHEYDETDILDRDDEDKMGDVSLRTEPGTEGVPEKKKYDPKDPTRPRRKKARRACLACQRAHLTCGDERPCQRCVKRGLAEACQDGNRKKAKYLHDAPAEALRPVLGPNYNSSPPSTHQGGRQPSSTTSEISPSTGSFYPPTASATFSVYAASANQSQVGMQDGMGFGTQQSPISPTFQGSNNQRPQPIASLTMPSVSNDIAGYSNAYLDPTNAFDLPLEDLGFGSKFSALEFSMLHRIASGAADGAMRDPGSMSQQSTAGDINFAATPMFQNGVGQYTDPLYDASLIPNLSNFDPSRPIYSHGNLQHGLPHAFAIGAGPTNLASPSTENTASPQPSNFNFNGSPNATYSATPGDSQQQQQQFQQPPLQLQQQPQHAHHQQNMTAQSARTRSNLASRTAGNWRRNKDPSAIYDAVKEPYPYVSGFHNLFHLLKTRFSPENTLRIAKLLSSVRPSFISCTKTLNSRDLIFMEKCFQRTLFEYEDFMHNCPAPTIVCRRTGEVAAVNKEFSALTGWSREVLLGEKPNLNINLGGGGASGAPRSRSTFGDLGGATPRLQSRTLDTPSSGTAGGGGNRLQPVFIAELMDADSVIDFYEDYSRLAFSDGRGKVTRKCRLLKYRTAAGGNGNGNGRSGAAEEAGSGLKGDADDGGVEDARQQQQRAMGGKKSSILSNRVTRIDGEHGISKIEKDGKMDCSYCWTIKRDVFDIPMMIVINFLPCWVRDQEPHQLAV